jgi:predicted nuclease with RNAse H fold
MIVVGLDLAGPAGAVNTALLSFTVGSDRLEFMDDKCDGSDQDILQVIDRLSRNHQTVVGVDAPLSYEPGGGERSRDAALRRAIVKSGMHPGSVMAPTAPGMVYLTLRALGLTRQLDLLQRSGHNVHVVEVHPGAVLGLRGAPIEAVRTFSTDQAARTALVEWLRGAGLRGLRSSPECASHFVAAGAAALGAWKWIRAEPVWLTPADKPWHPYDFSC